MKPGQFSFLGDEFGNLFYFSDIFLPGIEKITGIYYAPTDKCLKMVSRIRDEQTIEDNLDLIGKDENRIMVQKFRSDGKPVAWVKKEEIPFELAEKKPTSPTIFSELENVILVLKFPNEQDGLNDLLFIYFSQNPGNFGLTRSDKPLSSENKAIIGYLLYNQFKSILKVNRMNKRVLNTYNQGVMSLVRNNATLRDQLREVQVNQADSMVNLARQFLSDYSLKQERNFDFTKEALEKIRTFHGNVRHLSAIIQNAIIFTENLMMPQEGDLVLIHDFCLDFDSYQIPADGEVVPRRIDSRQSRAMVLLDKLEKAATSLANRSVPMTSANVGKSMTPPISAPAITDALSKNKELVRQLISRHPDKWEKIRKSFRPLQNILRQDTDDKVIEASA
jgi:hypothetical protein